MKKCCTILLIFVMCLLCACQADTPTEPMTGIIHQELPQMVTFSSPALLASMTEAAELSESEFAEFLKQNNYSMRESDLSELKSLLQNAGCPIVVDQDIIQDFGMTYYPDKLNETSFDIIYFIDGVTYRFLCCSLPNKVISRSDMTPVATCAFSGDSVVLYQNTTHWLLGDIYTDDYYIGIRVTGHNSIEEISFEPFQWSCELNNIVPNECATE